ncbi:uncharacterized protein [Labrus bergylta]|uniref:uncharacterized protein isoform X2 n=1 Tax=Labrus bergylta TaxID=56723 RepID=UPI0009B49AF0|nr:uncharacterized protein LOC109999856 isoform X2 [Labrus bergylta]
MSLSVILMLLFTAVTGDDTASLTVKDGHDVTLPCGNVIKDQQKCDSTSWLFSHDSGSTAEELVTHGNISKNKKAKAKAKRLNVSEDCSLVIKSVTREDVGRYTCRQFRSGKQHGLDALLLLNVIKIDSDDPYRYYCSVFRFGVCAHTVQWYYKGDETDISEHQQVDCTAAVIFTTEVEKSKIEELLFCNVTDKQSGQTQLCNSISKSSCDKTVNSTTKKGRFSTERDWLPYVIVAAGLAAFLIILIVVVAFIRRKRTKGKKTQRGKDIGQSLTPAVTQQGPETSQEETEHEDVVAYASISYTKKGNSRAQADGDAEGEGVTYSTVKVPSSDTEASVDPSSLYATVNKPNKRETTG